MPSPASTAALEAFTSVRMFTGATGRSRLRDEWQLRPQSGQTQSTDTA